MADPFDPYQAWFGIPPQDQPPDHYRLLGIQRFEKRAAVIETAASMRMDLVQKYKDGPQAEICQRIVGEITSARLCLLSDHRRTAYDANLYRKMAASAVRAASEGRVRRVSAEEFIEILAAKDLVPPAILVALRSQFGNLRTFTPAEEVVKLLVAKGLLTRVLADRLLESAAGGKPAEQESLKQSFAPGSATGELTLAPDKTLQGSPARSAAQPKPKPVPKVAEIADRGPATLLEDPTLGGALSARTPQLKVPRKRGWFSWLRLPEIPKLGRALDTWMIWLIIAAILTAILFLAVLIYALRQSQDAETSARDDHPAFVEVAMQPQTPSAPQG